ncbi:MAG: MotA/TolQ/ExbB proton channel family protein [Clostridium sp.]|nr:MotA/TolQ/ExbB proton channel family protein [Clostridium sp.]
MSLFMNIMSQAVESAADTAANAAASEASTATDSVVTTLAETASAATPPAVEHSISVWDLCVQGGFIMVPLALLSIICVYIFVERAVVIARASRDDDSFMRRIKDYIHEGDIEAAESLCDNTDTPWARLIGKGVSRIGRPMNDVLAAVENTGNLEISRLGKGLPWLATTAAGAPMLGFLGTVVGMVQAFFNLAEADSGANIGILAGGIYEALVTTVAGLVVGIVALFAYNYLVARINKVMMQLEGKTMEFMDLLNEPSC